MQAEVLNISPAVIWIVAASQVLTFGLTVWNIMSSGSRANTKRLDDHADRLQSHGNRLQALEMGQQQLPSSKDFHDLDVRMTKLQGAMEVLTERLKPVESIAERLQEAMIEQGRK